jgi:acyl carrier protein
MTTAISEEILVADVIVWVREHRQPGSSDEEISADTDLLGSGLLDSLGMVDLILFVERQHGYKVDLIDVDPNEFSVVKGLCRIALTQNHAGVR